MKKKAIAIVLLAIAIFAFVPLVPFPTYYSPPTNCLQCGIPSYPAFLLAFPAALLLRFGSVIVIFNGQANFLFLTPYYHYS
ncbi:MAG: hypothetical protein ACYCPP_09830 [Nitrososphaerales archaeon]